MRGNAYYLRANSWDSIDGQRSSRNSISGQLGSEKRVYGLWDPRWNFPFRCSTRVRLGSAAPRRSFAVRKMNTMLLGAEFARPLGPCVIDWRQPGIGHCITETLYCRCESGSSTKHNYNTTRCSSVHFNFCVPRSSRLKPLWATLRPFVSTGLLQEMRGNY